MNKIQNLIQVACLLILSTALFTSCSQENKISTEELLLLKESVSETNANWQLFIDDYWVSSSKNITSSLHQPEKNQLNPLIQGDVPWEQNPYCFGTVIYDEEASVFKFWYQSYNDMDVSLQERTPVLYATSKDGIVWKRPNLGLFEFQGSKDNNIILQNYGHHDLYSPSVIKDSSDSDPEKRYKMIWWDFPLGKEGYQDDGMCVAFSPDGIHWKKYPDNPVLQVSKNEKSISDVMSVMQDKNTGKFVAYTKGWADPWPSHRQIVRVESTDFIHWSEPEVVIRHAFDLKDPQSYGMTTSQYGNNYIGMMYSYKKPGNETIDVQLVISHDNKNWQRVANQKTFIPLGKSGSWDDGMIFTTPLFNHKNKTLIYYSAWDNSHDSEERRRSGIGLATLRLNGFVSLDAKKNGSIITRRIKNAQGPLLVNAIAEEGFLRAELLDVNGEPISGYTINDCIPIQSNDVAGPIQWKNQVRLPDLVQFSIHFQMENASLYGFYAGKDAERINFDFTQELSEDIDIVTIAKHLIEVNKKGGYTRSLALNYPDLTKENAYKIQMEMLRQLENQGERLVGWKMGGANLDNFNPAFGFMLASDAHKAGEPINKNKFVEGSPLMEAEIGFVLKKDLPGPVISKEELMEAMDSVGGYSELINLRTRNLEGGIKVPESHSIADRMSHGGFIYPSSHLALGENDINQVTANVVINDKVMAEGNSKNFAFLDAVLYLANSLPKYDRYLRSGDIIITGSILTPPPVRSADKVEINFSEFVTLEAELK